MLSVSCQSLEEGWEVLCATPKACPNCITPTKVEESLITAHLDKHLSNDDIRNVFASMKYLSSFEKGTYLSAQAKYSGLKSCQLAQAYQALAAQ